MDNLKNCPFCGPTKLRVYEWGVWYVRCTDCDAQQFGTSRDDAIADWNRRGAGVATTSTCGTKSEGLSEPKPSTREAEAPVSEAVAWVARVMEVREESAHEGVGTWVACSGCQESVDGCVSTRDYPYSAAFGCQPGSGCSECGGLGVLWDTTDWDEAARFMLACDDHPSPSPASAWKPIETHDGSKKPVLLIGLYRDGKTWSDIYHGWWQPPFESVDHSGEGTVMMPGAWACWPHPFPPTHFLNATPPATEGATE